ncbi:MAG: tyrosine-type recombinase/integrase [Chloroflexota bacterium]
MSQPDHETVALPGLPLADAERQFLESLRGKSPRTVSTYRSALGRFAEFLTATGTRPDSVTTNQFNADVLERFYLWLAQTYGREDRFTVDTYVAGTRAFFRYLARRRLLASGLSFEEVRDNLREVRPRTIYKSPRIDDRLALIVTHVDALSLPADAPRLRLELLRDRALLRTLFTTGMRREEVANLDRVDVQDGRLRDAIISGKGSKERVVFFDEPCLRAIRAYVEARADVFRPLFLRHDKSRPVPGPRDPHGRQLRLSPQSVWGVVKRYAAAVGVEASTHDFRHAKATVLLNRGARLSEVQDILGHASPETTKRIYAHYERAHLRDVFDRFSASAEELAEAALDS